MILKLEINVLVPILEELKSWVMVLIIQQKNVKEQYRCVSVFMIQIDDAYFYNSKSTNCKASPRHYINSKYLTLHKQYVATTYHMIFFSQNSNTTLCLYYIHNCIFCQKETSVSIIFLSQNLAWLPYILKKIATSTTTTTIF